MIIWLICIYFDYVNVYACFDGNNVVSMSTNYFLLLYHVYCMLVLPKLSQLYYSVLAATTSEYVKPIMSAC